jgi:DNA modification methylase
MKNGVLTTNDKMPKIELIQGDCLENMKDIPDKSVDAIICDLPYGTTVCKWDTIISFNELWVQYNRIIKDNGAIVLFGKEPFSSLLRTSNLDMFKYDWIWKKDTKSNFPQAGFQPLNNIEIISVFSKAYARAFPENDTKHISMKYNPQMKDGKEYTIPKESKTTQIFGTNHKNGKYKHKQKDTTKRFPFNTLEFKTDKDKFHPTQKPIAILEYLIKTYTNEGDTVLDNCMGSGTTGVACKNLNRNFIGIELDSECFKIAEKRINGNL